MTDDADGPATDPPSHSPMRVERSALDGMSVGVAVVGAVAARTDTDAVEVDPLHEAVDVDALDRLWTPPGSEAADVRVTFPYMGYDVTVTGEELRLVPRDGPPAGSD